MNWDMSITAVIEGIQYGMNNYRQTCAAKGKELFISNYPVDHERRVDRNLDLGGQLVLDFAHSSSNRSL